MEPDLVPDRLHCRPEERVWDNEALDRGFVDLLFEDNEGAFTLLVELKLYSPYGREQVTRYLKARERYERLGRRAALLAVTRNTPAYGEPERQTPGWLGSVRWADLLEDMKSLEHRDEAVTLLWRAMLDILDRQGDLGVTEVDRNLVAAWARFTAGRDQLEQLMYDIADGALETVERELTTRAETNSPKTAGFSMRGKNKKYRVWPYHDRVHLRIGMPTGADPERLRIQFIALWSEGPYFTVEARHENAFKLPESVQDNLRRIEDELGCSKELTGGWWTDHKTWWTHLHDLDTWLGNDPSAVAKTLQRFVDEDVAALVRSGIFDDDALGFGGDEP
jgi:hypothetical protein